MKQKITIPDNSIEPVEKEKSCNNATSDSTDEMQELMYLLVYCYPFMPIIDFAMVFGELKNMVKSWFQKKDITQNINKKKIHETI